MKLHVLSNPRVPTGLSNPMEPFSVLIYKYIKYIHKKFDMVHYGLPGSQVDCEHVEINAPVTYEKTMGSTFNRLINHKWKTNPKLTPKPGDMILCFFGVENSSALLDIDLTGIKVVEPSIGYHPGAIFAPYKVFTSYAHMHMFYGQQGMLMNPLWTDAVIPNAISTEDFEYKETKQNYFLYLGRVIKEKGIDLCIQATKKLDQKLIIAGPGDLKELGYDHIPDHVTCVGLVGPEERKKLLADAKCLLAPTYYVEPFGNMVIEANMSGTPVITTDWGAFTETVIHGTTGFRFRNFDQMILYMKNVNFIDPYHCRIHAQSYSDESIHNLHIEYIHRISKGFYES